MKVIFRQEQALHRPRWEWNFGKRNPYPEKASRVNTILQHLKKRGFGEDIVQARSYPTTLLNRVHDPRLVRHIKSCRDLPEGQRVYAHIFPYRSYQVHPRTDLKRAGYYCFDVGTDIDRYTYDAAKSAVDVALHGAELIAKGKETHVFAVCRPPGHHADRAIYGGYCYFNNAAIAAFRLSQHGRVAVLDLDFHHGNGTQSLFYESPHVFVASLHGDPRYFYPYFCGFRTEKGEGLGRGCNLNQPLPIGTDDQEYLRVLTKTIKTIKKFAPHSLVVSMGFDTFVGDPVGGFTLTSECYTVIGGLVRRVGVPVLACLEGGYAVKELGVNAANFFTGLACGD